MSLETLKSKVEQLVEKAQSGGDTKLIEYPEFGYTRPSYWLPYPTLTEGEDVNEIWLLMEVPDYLTEYDGIDIANAKVVREGYKQFWKRVEGTEVTDETDVVEIHANCVDNFRIISTTKLMITSNYRPNFAKLELISGTPLYIDSTSNSPIFVRSLRAIVNDVYIAPTKSSTVGGLFSDTNLLKVPNIKTSFYGHTTFRRTPIIDGGAVCINGSGISVFDSCNALEKVELIEGSVTQSTTFKYCYRLKDIKTYEGFKSSLYLEYSTEYSSETLHAIIENFADMTGQTAPTFKIGADNIPKIDEEHIAMLNTKNWIYE